MERLKMMKNQLMACVEGQMSNLAQADTEELGQAVDMIKDLEEAMYYCSIVKAMEEREKEEKEGKKREHHHYYTERYLPYDPYMMGDYRNMDRDMGRMYYPRERDSQGRFTEGNNMGSRYYGGNSGGGNSGGNSSSSSGGMSSSGGSSGSSSGGGNSRGFHDQDYPIEMRDYREGQSPIRRKYYMEAKELKQDKKTQMEELEKYMHELSKDITEMISDASPEETTLLKQKLVGLIEKIK